MLIREPRISRMSGSPGFRSVMLIVSSSSPSTMCSRMFPASMRPGRGTICNIDCAVTLLPQPDSPTTPRVRPLAMVRLAPFTALTTPSRR